MAKDYLNHYANGPQELKMNDDNWQENIRQGVINSLTDADVRQWAMKGDYAVIIFDKDDVQEAIGQEMSDDVWQQVKNDPDFFEAFSADDRDSDLRDIYERYSEFACDDCGTKEFRVDARFESHIPVSFDNDYPRAYEAIFDEEKVENALVCIGCYQQYDPIDERNAEKVRALINEAKEQARSML